MQEKINPLYISGEDTPASPISSISRSWQKSHAILEKNVNKRSAKRAHNVPFASVFQNPDP